jgi:hypothetical protein
MSLLYPDPPRVRFFFSRQAMFHDSLEQGRPSAACASTPTASKHRCAKIACVETAGRLIYDH